MANFAVMMLCRSGTVYMPSDMQYAYSMHVVTITGHDTEAEAYDEARRLRPAGFNREAARYWVAPWEARFDPYSCPREAMQWILR
jgi:hypothetical protein